MAEEIVLPQWGMEMQDATIVKWLKQEGDAVQVGEPLVEVETAKIETEMESTASGVLAHILVPEGASGHPDGAGDCCRARGAGNTTTWHRANCYFDPATTRTTQPAMAGACESRGASSRTSGPPYGSGEGY